MNEDDSVVGVVHIGGCDPLRLASDAPTTGWVCYATGQHVVPTLNACFLTPSAV